jgi:glycosyltransferase involved in cell wall biosynthesis
VQSEVKVTIGVCVKNCEAAIKEAIESIINQDFPHELIEVIFVDDGSEDETLSIIKSYMPKMDMHVKAFHHEWRGLGATRNTVVNRGTADYIVWVDGDMILQRDYARKQVEFMEKNEEVAIARGVFSGLPQKSLVATLENLEWVAISFLARKQGKTESGLHFCGGSIYRVKAIKEVGGFDERIKGAGEDEEIEDRLRKAGWLISNGAQVMFFEKRKNTWRGLWNQYFWYGHSARYLFGKKKKVANYFSFLMQFSCSKTAYGLTRKKIAFLLPLEYGFKALASFLGFIEAKIHSERR